MSNFKETIEKFVASHFFSGKLKTFLLSCILIAGTTLSHAQAQFDVLNTGTENTFVASSFINDNEGWLADTKSILWHTNDAGEIWNTVFSGKQFAKINFIDATNGFALGNGEAYKTSDGGVSWELLPLDNTGLSLYFLNENTGFISGKNVIYKTTDNGATWSTTSTEVQSFVDYYFVNESVGIAAASDFTQNLPLWKTTDGGSTWKNIFDNYHYYINSVWFINENTGWAAGYFDQGGSTHEPAILETTDGGETWKTIYQNQEVTGIGESFIDIPFKNELEGFAISNLNVNVFTTDGGSSWLRADETETFGLPEFNGYYKTIDGYNDMYLIGNDGYVVKWK